jgi:hypothetical protein
MALPDRGEVSGTSSLRPNSWGELRSVLDEASPYSLPSVQHAGRPHRRGNGPPLSHQEAFA